jgi:calcineurin-like phosphoesterase family protein
MSYLYQSFIVKHFKYQIIIRIIITFQSNWVEVYNSIYLHRLRRKVPFNTLFVSPHTWIISDTHFFHENIGLYCNRPENWQELIINNWNDLISPDETVLHLGDFALGKKSDFELITGILNGKLFLIQGNHDRLSNTYWETQGVILIKDSVKIEMEDHEKLIFLHRAIVPLEIGSINLNGHIHNVSPPPEGSHLGLNHFNMSGEVNEYLRRRLRCVSSPTASRQYWMQTV